MVSVAVEEEEEDPIYASPSETPVSADMDPDVGSTMRIIKTVAMEDQEEEEEETDPEIVIGHIPNPTDQRAKNPDVEANPTDPNPDEADPVAKAATKKHIPLRYPVMKSRYEKPTSDSFFNDGTCSN